MEEYDISSKLIKTIGFQGRTMLICLTDGKILSYNSVPREIYDAFVNSSEPDEFYAKQIVPVFSSQRMS